MISKERPVVVDGFLTVDNRTQTPVVAGRRNEGREQVLRPYCC